MKNAKELRNITNTAICDEQEIERKVNKMLTKLLDYAENCASNGECTCAMAYKYDERTWLKLYWALTNMGYMTFYKEATDVLPSLIEIWW